jgi:hypothetical protein
VELTVQLLVHLREVRQGAQVQVPHLVVGQVMEEDMVITTTDEDPLLPLPPLRLREGILTRPLRHSNHHRHRLAGIRTEAAIHLHLPHLSNSRDSTLAVTNIQGIQRHPQIHGRILETQVGLRKEAHKQPDLAMGAGVRLKELGCSQDKQVATAEVRVSHIVVAVRVRVQVRVRLLEAVVLQAVA